MEQEQQTMQPEQIMPEISDGMTDNLQPLPEQTIIQPEQIMQSDHMMNGTATAECSNFYTKAEFYEQFKSLFQFAGDTLQVQSLPIKPNEEVGAKVTSDRIYNMAEKYAFLRFLIDKRSTKLGETILMIQFLTSKASAVYKEKRNRKLGLDLWQKFKKLLKKGSSRANDTDYLVQAAAEKQQKQES